MLLLYYGAYTQITPTGVQAPGFVITHYHSARNKDAQMLEGIAEEGVGANSTDIANLHPN